MTRIHWVARGTGTPKDNDEVNRRDVVYNEMLFIVVYYESRKRELKIRLMNEGRFIVDVCVLL
jgi:hypothetical protein